MTPGPTLIYKCPTCEGLFSRRTIASGNTAGSKVRSDGMLEAPYFPRNTPLAACPHCHKSFYLAKAIPEKVIDQAISKNESMKLSRKEQLRKFIEDLDSDVAEPPRDEIPAYKQATSTQCLEFLRTQKLSLDEETLLRIYAWYCINDERMQTTPRSLKPEEAYNLEALLVQLEHDKDESGALLRSEILRELGYFEKAAQALDVNIDNAMMGKAEQILRAIERHDIHPFMFITDSHGDDSEYTWAWIARHYRPDNPKESDDTAMHPPLFKIGNRDWWVKVLGMISQNWALIDIQPDNNFTVYFFHDMGAAKSPNNFSNHSIRKRSAIVDSLNFQSIEEATRALYYNDFSRLLDNPGPWFGYEPTGSFYDARTTEEGIYSKKGYWKEDALNRKIRPL